MIDQVLLYFEQSIFKFYNKTGRAVQALVYSSADDVEPKW